MHGEKLLKEQASVSSVKANCEVALRGFENSLYRLEQIVKEILDGAPTPHPPSETTAAFSSTAEMLQILPKHLTHYNQQISDIADKLRENLL